MASLESLVLDTREDIEDGMPLPAGRYRVLRERIVGAVITTVGMTGIAAMALILLFVGREAFRSRASLSQMFLPQSGGFVWQPISATPKISMVPLWVGTLKISVIALALAVPLGILSALFVAELAPRRAREVLKPTIELLAGVPSVVLGFFALVTWAGGIQAAFDTLYRLNALVAAVGLAIALVPVVFTVAEDALVSVPQSYREGSLALGATRWETAWRVTLPAAVPGVIAAGVLAFGRAVGETMIVLMASGNAPVMSWAPSDSARTLSATIAAEMGEVVSHSPHASLLFFIGVELFALTFVLNLIADAWRKRALRRLAGAPA